MMCAYLFEPFRCICSYNRITSSSSNSRLFLAFIGSVDVAAEITEHSLLYTIYTKVMDWAKFSGWVQHVKLSQRLFWTPGGFEVHRFYEIFLSFRYSTTYNTTTCRGFNTWALVHAVRHYKSTDLCSGFTTYVLLHNYSGCTNHMLQHAVGTIHIVRRYVVDFLHIKALDWAENYFFHQ